MDAAEIFGAIVNAILMAVLAWAWHSNRVRDGIIVKLGIGLIWLGAFAELQALLPSEDYSPVWVRATFMSCGVLIAFAGIMNRQRRHPNGRRASDMILLQSAELRNVSGGFKNEL